MIVFVAIYTWPSGESVRVYGTRARAQQAMEETADEWWEAELPGKPKPDDPRTAASQYFSLLAGKEEFRILDLPVIGNTHSEEEESNAKTDRRH